SVVTGLRSGARHHEHFGLQGSERVTDFPARVSDGRVRRSTTDAIANAYVSALVHGGTCHPAIVRIGRKGALLKDSRCAVWRSHLVPADASVSGSGENRVVGDERFMIAEFSIRQAVHQAVTDGIQFLSSSRLGNAVLSR